MKKVLAGIAVLAFVAAAQAELLASWGNLGAAQTGAEGVEMGGYTYYDSGSTVGAGALGVKDIKLAGGDAIASTSSGTAYIFQIGGGEGKGIQFDYTVTEGSVVDGATLSAYWQGTAKSPASYSLKVNGTETDTLSMPDSKYNLESLDLGTLSGSGTVSLIANTSAKIDATTGAASGNFRVGSAGIDLEGTVKDASAVPEPATMSLLGLGALAMVIRRKLSK